MLYEFLVDVFLNKNMIKLVRWHAAYPILHSGITAPHVFKACKKLSKRHVRIDKKKIKKLSKLFYAGGLIELAPDVGNCFEKVL